MEQTKPAYQSITLWAALAVLVVQVPALFGIGLSPAEAMSITAHLDNILTSAAALVVAWGRIRATTQIKSP